MQANRLALFRLGFRPFFLAAALFAIISMAIWMAELVFSAKVLPAGNTPMFWHAHEMIYGYALAVIAGFLLTAVRNWTSTQTLHGQALQGLLLLWLLARVASFTPGHFALIASAVLDGLFIIGLSAALTAPVVRAKLWKNMGVVSKIYFFLVGDVIYSLGLLGVFHDGQRIGLYIGLYMILSLILVLSRRVMPMFIERGVGYAVTLKNHLWVDISCFLLFLVFAISDIFFAHPALTAWLAASLCVLHAIRLWGWYTHGIWSKPLLWVLYLAYAWIMIGFGLKFIAFMLGIPPSLAIHAFTVGGIGMMTLGMMSRISLGHTGRDIMHPPSGLGVMFFMLFISAFTRVVLPWAFAGDYLLWVGLSQVFWIASFALFLYLYAPVLMRPRIDGRWG